MRTRLLDDQIAYTGAQLRSGWIAEVAGLSGDAAVAFLGPCDVAPEHMVDTVDLQAGARIYSPRMVHIIIEHPGLDLIHITVRQRLLIAIAGEIINGHLGEALIRRDGDDLYLRDRKLSVSVATVSPTSGLIHAGFNVRGEGAPVPAIGLEELGITPWPPLSVDGEGAWGVGSSFAERLLASYASEIEGIASAAAKVRPVL